MIFHLATVFALSTTFLAPTSEPASHTRASLAAFEHALPQAKPDPVQWPPPGVYRAGRDGVTVPRILKNTGPMYTPEAMRARIEGAVVVEAIVEEDGTVGEVRVLRSLDRNYGLDEEAVKAARAWRFVPAMKDNAPVRCLVALEMTFSLDHGPTSPAPLAWPAMFPTRPWESPDNGMWKEYTSETGGTRLTFRAPESWTVQEQPDWGWVAVQNGARDTRIVRITGRRTSAALVPHSSSRLSQQALLTAIARVKQQLVAAGSKARVEASAQVNPAGRLWLWYEMWVPADDLRMPRPLGAAPPAWADGARAWSFVTTAGPLEIVVDCYVLHDREAAASESQARQLRAATVFEAILSSMVIEQSAPLPHL